MSEHYAQFAGRSERELMLATAELRRRHQRHAQQLAITARKLADFLASVEAEEVLLRQRLRDAEGRVTIAQDGHRRRRSIARTIPADDGLDPVTVPRRAEPDPRP